MNKFKALISASIIGVAALAVTACGGSQKPEEVAVEYSKAMFGSDAKKVMSFLDLEGAAPGDVEMVEGKIKASLEATAAKAESKGGYKETKVLGVEGTCAKEGEVCSVNVQHSFGNGETEDGKVVMKNVDGKITVKK